MYRLFKISVSSFSQSRKLPNILINCSLISSFKTSETTRHFKQNYFFFTFNKTRLSNSVSISLSVNHCIKFPLHHFFYLCWYLLYRTFHLLNIFFHLFSRLYKAFIHSFSKASHLFPICSNNFWSKTNVTLSANCSKPPYSTFSCYFSQRCHCIL